MVTMTLRIKAANRRMAAGMQKRRAMAGVGGLQKRSVLGAEQGLL